MYCKASATLAITSASRIRLMAYLEVKTNWAANLPIRGQTLLANPLQSEEIGDWHAACVESSCAERLGEHLVRLYGRVLFVAAAGARRPGNSGDAGDAIRGPTPIARVPSRAPAAAGVDCGALRRAQGPRG